MVTLNRFIDYNQQLSDPITIKSDRFILSNISIDYSISWKSCLGEGLCGKVYQCKSIFNNKDYALKILPDSKSNRREVSLQRRCSSNGVVEIIDVYLINGIHPGNKPGVKYLYVVLEMMSGGELFDLISNSNGLGEESAANILKQIALTLKDIHNKGIIHRDIKPENILLQSPYDAATPQIEVKLADFGFACEESSKPTSPDYTPYYVSPEILNNDKKCNPFLRDTEIHSYDHRCDIWSLGVVAYILLVASPPFYPEHAHLDMSCKMYRNIINGKFVFHSSKWYGISIDAQQLISSMLKPNPNERATIDQILTHPWILKNAC